MKFNQKERQSPTKQNFIIYQNFHEFYYYNFKIIGVLYLLLFTKFLLLDGFVNVFGLNFGRQKRIMNANKLLHRKFIAVKFWTNTFPIF